MLLLTYTQTDNNTLPYIGLVLLYGFYFVFIRWRRVLSYLGPDLTPIVVSYKIPIDLNSHIISPLLST